jgi:hypothetical protein
MSPTPELWTPLPRRGPPGRLLVALFLLGVVITALCGQAAYFWADSKPEVWAARAEIEYRDDDSWVETQQVLLASNDLQEPVARAEGIPTDELSRHLTTQLVAGTQALRVQYQDEDPDRALRVVEALTAGYIERVLDRPLAPLQDRVDLEAEIQNVKFRLNLMREELRGIEVAANEPTPPRLLLLQTEIQAALVEQSSLERELLLLDAEQRQQALDRQPAVLTQPFVLDEPVEPAPLRTAVLGCVTGLLLSTAVAFLVLRQEVFRAPPVAINADRYELQWTP